MRRLTAAAGITVALLGLASCRSAPDVAAYVGDTRFTEAEVTRLTEPLKGQVTRESVVHLLVIDALCKRVAAEKGITPPAAEPTPAGQPELSAVGARVQSCVQGWLAKAATPVKPTEADIREIYDNGVRVGAIDPAKTYEEVAPDLRSEETAISAALGSRKIILDAAKAEDVSINPRYGAVPIPVLSFEQGPAIAATVGRPNDAVTDAPVAAPTVTPAPGS